jgi:HEAT repeat protein
VLALLAECGPAARDAVPALRRLLQEEDTSSAALAADALARIGPAARAAAPELRALVSRRPAANDPPPQADALRRLRLSAAAALIALGEQTEAAYAALAEGLDFQPHRQWYGGSDLPPAEGQHRRAVALLAQGQEAALPALRRALADRNESVRAAAAQVLSRFAKLPDGVRDELRRLIEEDYSPDVRLMAAVALAQRASSSFRPADLDVLLTGLGRAGGFAPAGKMRAWLFDWREAVVEAVRRLDPAAQPKLVPALIRALASEDRFTREGAAEALAGLAAIERHRPVLKEAVPALKERLNREPQLFQGKVGVTGWAGQWALVALARLDPESIPVERLVATLGTAGSLAGVGQGYGYGDDNRDFLAAARLREAVLDTLEAQEGRTLPALVKGLKAGGPAAQALAILAGRSPGRRVPPPAVQALITALSDADPVVRRQAGVVLGQLQPECGAGAVGAALRKALEDRDPGVRLQAAASLWQTERDGLGAADRETLRRIALGLADPDQGWGGPAAALLTEIGAPAAEAPRLLALAVKVREALPAYYAAAPEALPLLAATLAAEDGAVRARAVEALANFGPAAVPALVERLQGPAAVRRAAAEALGRQAKGAADAAAALRRTLKDDDADVRLAAAVALWQVSGRGGDAEPVLAALLTEPGTAVEARRQAAATLAQIGSPAALQKALKDADVPVRLTGIGGLVRLGKNARAALCDFNDLAARDPDLNVRRSAVRALGQLGRNLPEDQLATAKVLLDRLNDPDKNLRREALRALRLLDVKRVGEVTLPYMIEALKSPDEERRDAAETYLSQAGVKALPYLTPLLADPAASVEARVAAAEVVAEQDQEGRATVPALLKMAQDGKRQVRLAGLRALAAVQPQAGPAVPVLVAALDDADPEVRAAAGNVLARMGAEAKEAVPQIVERLRRPAAEARTAAATLLGRLGPVARPAAPALLAVLKEDRDAEVRAAAAAALSRVQAERAQVQPAYRVALKDMAPAVRRQAAAGLAQLGGEAVADLLGAATDVDAEVRRTVLGALANLAPPPAEALPAFIRALNDLQADVRVSSARGLGQMGPAAAPAVEALARALGDAQPAVRVQAATALGQIGAPARAAVPALKAIRRDPNDEVRRAVAEALEKFGP